MEDHLSNTVSSLAVFPPCHDKLYFYTREAYIQDPINYSKHMEGYCSTIKFRSELMEGRVYADGNYTYDIGLGDTFTLDVKPEYRLKCIRF